MINLERVRYAPTDCDDASGTGSLHQFRLVVDEHDGGHVEDACLAHQLAEGSMLDQARHEQHGIRAPNPGFNDLIRTDDEVGAEHREVAQRPRRKPARGFPRTSRSSGPPALARSSSALRSLFVSTPSVRAPSMGSSS